MYDNIIFKFTMLLNPLRNNMQYFDVLRNCITPKWNK